MNKISISDPICGLWVAPNGKVKICHAGKDGQRYELESSYMPFVWTKSSLVKDVTYAHILPLEGPENLNLDTLAYFYDSKDYADFLKVNSRESVKIANLENQFLMAHQLRCFDSMEFSSLRRMQLDIETFSEDSFPDATKKSDRILAIGLFGIGGTKILELSEFTDEAERKLLEEFNHEIQKRDPDTIEGHNIFAFDLDYMYKRCKLLKVNPTWGRFSQNVQYRKSRINIAERIFDYPRFDIAGRAVVDTYILIQLYDISARELESYSLKKVALHFKISKEEERTYIEGNKIKNMFNEDRALFIKYLKDDLRETAALADKLLPTYFAQMQNFPLTFQECMLRGSGMKIENIFLEQYFKAKAKIPEIPESFYIAGALSESMEKGVFENVLHYDVASLYPSLLLMMGKCPENDYLSVFLKSLEALREYRLKYKKLARECEDPIKKSEYNARQNSFKILINSFYGYLGLATARFGDSALADEVTRKGRELLTALIDSFKELSCKILEVDTDGIYLSSKKYYKEPVELLKKVSQTLPIGIDLEFDGAYERMFCYKAKNYALFGEDGMIIKGSAFRNRSTENYLRKLTSDFLETMLDIKKGDVKNIILKLKEEINSGNFDVKDLAKSEYISMSLDSYKSQIEKTGKGRRASLEAALQIVPQPKVGDKISYYITDSPKKEADWKLARAVSLYDKEHPYNKTYYVRKLTDWIERYAEFVGDLNLTDEPIQGELF